MHAAKETLTRVCASQGFMERAMAGGGGGSAKGAGAAAVAMGVEDTGEEAAWGDDADLILDEGTSSIRVQQHGHKM